MMPAFHRCHKRNSRELCKPDMTDQLRTLRYPATLVLALLLLLAGCTPVSFNPEADQSPDQLLDSARDMNDRAEAQRLLLQAADRFQGEGQHRDARKLLQSDIFDPTTETSKSQHLLLSMASAVALEDRTWATSLAESLDLDQFQRYRDGLQEQAAQLQTETFKLAQKPLQAALTLISAGPLLAMDDAERNDEIWQLLKKTPADLVADRSESAIGFDTQGWLELALILRESGMTLESQGRAVRDWQNNWAGHPAAEQLPSELALIMNLSQERPELIALALPLSGPLASAGTAIREGFMAAFYGDEARRDYDIIITVTDTHEKNFTEVYDQLRRENPDLIVGPLEKEALASVMERDSMPVPLMALNYYDQQSEAPDRLYQFGLSAEDEARQIAKRLEEEDLDQVLVLIPDGDWGDRVEAALLASLEETGGTALSIERFFRTDNLREVTADLLGINTSRQRAIAVEQTVGQNIEFEPRRRQDVDAIVMIAPPTLARQFKPLFAFYFASNIPVYSSSLVYEGKPDPSRDRDLDQVRFTDLPWVLDSDQRFRQTAGEAFPNMGGQLGRLFAMGADAYHLSARLPVLKQVEGSALEGQTGRLTMSKDGRIRREQMWAIFQKGEPQTLLPTDQSDEQQPEAQEKEDSIPETGTL